MSELSRTYHIDTGRRSNAKPLVTGEKISTAIDSTSTDYSIGISRGSQSRYSKAFEYFPSNRSIMAGTFFSAQAGWIRKRCPSSWTFSKNRSQKNHRNNQCHSAYNTTERYSLEYPQYGKSTWGKQCDSPTYMEGTQSETSSGRDFQAQPRQTISGETLRCCWPIYLNPPDKAIVFCVDEKSQIQALERTQPLLPLRPGIPVRQTHDYTRHGTTTLFAALNILDGTVIGDCMPRHRHQEFIRFLHIINTKTPSDLDLHLIVDNYGAHKHLRVQRWLKRHPRFHLHFTPTSSSWLNMVERWFSEITSKRIRRGSFKNIKELIMGYKAIYRIS